MKRLLESRAWPWVRDLTLVALLYLGVRTYQQWQLPSGQAPALSAVDLRGDAVSLQDYRGKPVMLHFWATWCGVCKATQSSIEAIGADLPVLTVATRSGDAAAVLAYMRQHELSLPVLPDPTGSLAQRFGVGAFPTTFVIDGDGEIRHTEVGYTTELGLRVRMWLAQR